ncbi:MAG: hypothetical protein HYV35_04875 [Lentisphaerae bacterium]|nr:hypothetical protein [Lentisphaerota bacterium]
MDTLAHAVYGAALFSRTGLAGGRRGAVDKQLRAVACDWTLWAAAGFGLLPDVFSLGIYFTQLAFTGEPLNFSAIPAYVLVLYKLTHSLIVASLGLGLLRLCGKPLVVPALAWPFHIFMDIFTHPHGPFQTPFLYPLSDFAFNGLRWWLHPWFIRAYWALVALLWLGIVIWRRRRIRPKAAS